MKKLPTALALKLQKRIESDSFRELSTQQKGVDFYSNDYLGFAKSPKITKEAFSILEKQEIFNGSTGSRLISGTHNLHLETEKIIADYHNADASLLYNSGYDANVGLFSSILQKGDVLIYDELIHASVRDGARLGLAKTYKFKHNCLDDFELKLKRFENNKFEVYVAIESIYSMDGDVSPIEKMVEICNLYGAKIIIDEAHSTGVFGDKGVGLVCDLGLESQVFARVHTFGKAMGCHGAVVLGSNSLRDYLINFSRSFIYTTALPLHAISTIMASYLLLSEDDERRALLLNINFFKKELDRLELTNFFCESPSSIQCCVVGGNKETKEIAKHLQTNNFLVKAILSPTVSKGKERIRICIHSSNSFLEITAMLSEIKNLLIRTA